MKEFGAGPNRIFIIFSQPIQNSDMRFFIAAALSILLFLPARAGLLVAPGRSITIHVNSDGHSIIGKDTMTLEQLSVELQKRLWKSYMGTGVMYSRIQLVFNGEVLMGVRGSAMDAIKLAQKNTLNDVCVQIHKKLYDALTSHQQEKLKKQFPVLFQEKYQ